MIELAGKFRISREYIKWKSQAATEGIRLHPN